MPMLIRLATPPKLKFRSVRQDCPDIFLLGGPVNVLPLAARPGVVAEVAERGTAAFAEDGGVAATAAALLLTLTPLIRPFGSRSTAQSVAETAAMPSTTTSWKSWTTRRYSWPQIRKETGGFDKGLNCEWGAGRLIHCGLALPSRTSHCHCHQLWAAVSCVLHIPAHTTRGTVIQ